MCSGRALQKNGLENKERVMNTFHRSCAQRKKESACLITMRWTIGEPKQAAI